MPRLTELRWRPLLLSFALGLLSVAAFAPVGAFPLIVATLAGLFRLLDNAARETQAMPGAKIGFAFGTGLFLGGVSWIYVSLSTFGGMPAPVAGLATLLFCLFLALYPALAGAVFTRFAPAPGWRRPLFFAALWALSEWLRGYLLTGFPWLAVGYTQTPPSPLAGFAPILGVFGISAAAAWLGASLALAYATWRARGTTAALRGPLLAIVLVLASGALLREIRWTEARGEPLSVTLIQGNIPQELKWRPEWFNESLRTYFRLAEENPAQLTVLPETAIPALYDQLPPGFIDALRGLALRQNGELILGVATGNAQAYANSAIAVGAAGLQRYDKSHLVPFGEFVPPGFRWLMDLAQIPMSDFTPGAARQAPIRIGALNAALDICYEDAFGEEIIRALPDADLLINLSNVAWFGDSLAPAQHLQIARMRALETGRMMLRATNTGMTAIIAADGRVVAKLPPFTRAALRGEVRAYIGTTPFVRGGNGPIVMLCLLCVALLWRRNTVS
ncbi:apolipoprotein N-acyltransferase [Propionivibrio dicarboxylicus]|uniref:Apolipoprotein N-acyltransferase n=1 Tax=Propionivibrio dicarboxylicus TaxID=83767 RepID=A0A1G8KCH7_9RHOO|nr:apolipoprotein N-acyltransferase [Propionivibrio dicarboxylicus]SDI41176.1 apolipoprotein N-acyltransferase [Propionivibrio dicarboxylicus]